MKKRTLILLITILILGFIISCDSVVSLPRNDDQSFYYSYDFDGTLDDYLRDLSENYSYFPQTGKTYNENDFREVTGYKASDNSPA